MRRKILFLLFLSAALAANAQRVVSDFNNAWLFVKGDTVHRDWKKINLPHTWNSQDVMDDSPGYYRGIGWYKKVLHVRKESLQKNISLHFEGVNQEANVFVNGKNAGHHIGGYTAFVVPISSFLKEGSNEILIRADNSFNENIPPLTADFTFYGGIYRDLFLVETNPIHFDAVNASTGVFITTPKVTEKEASAHFKILLSNDGDEAKKLIVTNIIRDAKGIKLAETSSALSMPANTHDSIIQNILSISNFKLWSPESPNLYSVQTTIRDQKGNLIDAIENPIAFRWFSFDAEKGFFLNGKSYKLIGASRHQDYQGLGNAVPNKLAVKDIVLLKQMGANFLRVAHYPQDPVVLHACDSLGLLASVEIPVVNEITESDSFYNNCLQMQTEMIRQNFNHPSVIVWCYMNEILLRPHYNNDKEKQKNYFTNIRSLAQRLEDLTRKEDPTRYTMMADHGSFSQYKNVGLLEIPMIVGWNLYSGWYGGKLQDFPVFLDDFHKVYPNKPVIVSEYGSDADPRIRSNDPIRFDKSIEYTTKFHQYYLSEIKKRAFVAGAAIWNLADFNSETRTETMPHINNKGLMTWNRMPKDPYYYYQAMLSNRPYVKILGDKTRYGIADSAVTSSLQTVQIASNLKSIVVSVNGKNQIADVVEGLAEIKFPFTNGLNVITAQDADSHKAKDALPVRFYLQPYSSFDPHFRSANIILGTTRFFIDAKGNWWQPDMSYRKKNFGSIGGARFKMQNNSRLPYGTDKSVLSTNDDPIYQTQQVGIQQYRFDVIPGTYRVIFHFAELLGGEISALPYNLSEEKANDKINRRVFDVFVNGKKFISDLNLAHQYGSAKAVSKTTIVTVPNNNGILIDFKAKEGQSVLNAIQIQKIK